MLTKNATLINTEIISTKKQFHSLRKEWQELSNITSRSCIFTSWEWMYTWWEVYENDGNRQLYILVLTNEDSKVVGIAPFQIVNNPKRYFPNSKQLIMLGAGETDGSSVFGEYMDLIISPKYEQIVIFTLSQYLTKHKHLWHGLKFNQLLEGSHLSHLFEGQQDQIIKEIKPQGFRSVIELPDTHKEYLMSLKGKVRGNIKRSLSRLEREQFFSIESITDTDKVEKAMATLAKLSKSRREVLNDKSVFDYPNFLRFHQIVAKRLLERDAISLRILRFGNEPVAATYQFIDRDTVHGYQSGFNFEKGKRYSLLTLLVTQEISYSIENKNIDYFNFMYSENETSYKKKYTGITETMYKLSFDHNNLRSKLFYFIHGPVKELVKRIVLRSK